MNKKICLSILQMYANGYSEDEILQVFKSKRKNSDVDIDIDFIRLAFKTIIPNALTLTHAIAIMVATDKILVEDLTQYNTHISSSDESDYHERLFHNLSPREKEIVKLMGKDYTNEKIAKQFGIKPSSVRHTLRNSIYPSLGYKNRKDKRSRVIELGKRINDPTHSEISYPIPTPRPIPQKSYEDMKFGEQLQHYRLRSSLTQRSLSESIEMLIDRYLYDDFIGLVERGKTQISKDDRELLTGLIIILVNCGGMWSPDEANFLLYSGNYRALSPEEEELCFPSFTSD